MKKITTFLTSADRAEEAVNFYVSVFRDSKIESLVRMGGEEPGAKDSLLHATSTKTTRPAGSSSLPAPGIWHHTRRARAGFGAILGMAGRAAGPRVLRPPEAVASAEGLR